MGIIGDIIERIVQPFLSKYLKGVNLDFSLISGKTELSDLELQDDIFKNLGISTLDVIHGSHCTKNNLLSCLHQVIGRWIPSEDESRTVGLGRVNAPIRNTNDTDLHMLTVDLHTTVIEGMERHERIVRRERADAKFLQNEHTDLLFTALPCLFQLNAPDLFCRVNNALRSH